MTRHSTNKEIANILTEMAVLYEMDGVPFKPRAYEHAADAIDALSEEAHDIFKRGGEKAIEDIPHVGPGIAAHVIELVKTGHFKEYEKMKKKMPVDIAGLSSIEGVGPRTIKLLWQKLKIKDISGLERAAEKGLLAKIPHFGKRSEEKILKSIGFQKESGGRFSLGFILPEANKLEAEVRKFPEVERVVVGGSIRRWKETVGDIDMLAISKKPEKVMERFVKLPLVEHVYGTGPTKTNVRLRFGVDADIRVVPEESWGAALNYFTGSKDHNIALRNIALKHGWKLSEYGLYKGKRMIAGKTEEELYKALGLSYIEPELRETTGELEAAFRQAQGKHPGLPKLVRLGDIRGDLQVQTNWTDGSASIEEMADSAEDAGLEYIVITDHTKGLAMTGGLDEKKLAEQAKEIDAVNEKRTKAGRRLIILKGAEVNILKDGSLDIADDVLAKLDVVGASVHSHFALPREEQTKRVVRAMENPHIDIIFHLTGRLLNKREPIDIDIEKIISAAKRTGTVLEINASPNRLDIKDDYIKKCVEAGVMLSLDSDAHAPEHFVFLQFGVGQARRGWAEKKNIANTLPLHEFLKKLK